jgi:leucyl aminopeptidase (aminopeptidase T)
MPRQKLNSDSLNKANQRAVSLQAIDAQLDLGRGLTLEAYLAAITTHKTNLDDYNRTLSAIEQLARAVEESEKTLKDLTERMLLGVGAHYGKDSEEYVMAGGARKSEVAHTMSKARTGISSKKKAPEATVV